MDIIGKSNDSFVESENPFSVYLIYSKWSLAQIDDFLKDYGEVGFLRIVYDRESKETDRTITVLRESVYHALSDNQQSHQGRFLHIVPFLLKDGNFPSEKHNKTLFIPIPEAFTEPEKIKEMVADKLLHLSELEIIKKNSWTINIPLKSREKGEISGKCFVSFSAETPLKQIAFARILLTDTYWPKEEGERPVFRCFWTREKQPARETKIPRIIQNSQPVIKK